MTSTETSAPASSVPESTAPTTDPETSVLVEGSSVGLEANAAPASVVLDGAGEPERVIVVVTNSGTAPITALDLRIDTPPGTSADTFSVPDALAPGAGRTVEVTIAGRATEVGATVITATGESLGRMVAASATVSHPAAEPLAELTVTGDPAVTDQRDARLVAVISNSTDSPLDYELTAETQTPQLRFVAAGADPTSGCSVVGAGSIAPGDSKAVYFAVDAVRAGTGSATVTITAGVSASPVAGERLVSTYVLETKPFAEDAFAGPLGLAAAWLLPGLAALVTWTAVRAFLRRRRKVPTPMLPQKLDFSLLVPMLFLSLAVIAAYWLVTDINILDGYRLLDLAFLVLAAAVVSALFASFANWLHARGRKRVGPRTNEEEVLACAGQLRTLPVSEVDGATGLELWRDDGAATITPQIQVISYEDEINAVASRGQPGSASEHRFGVLQIVQVRGCHALTDIWEKQSPGGWIAGAHDGVVKVIRRRYGPQHLEEGFVIQGYCDRVGLASSLDIGTGPPAKKFNPPFPTAPSPTTPAPGPTPPTSSGPIA